MADSPPTANVRKLEELPFHFTRSERWEELVQCLCNLDFLITKARAIGQADMLADLEEAGGQQGVRAVPAWARSCVLLAGAMRMAPQNDVEQLPGQFLGRLVPSPDLPLLRALLMRCRTSPRVRDTSLLPLRPCLQPPGGPVLRTFAHSDKVHSVSVSPNRR